MWAYLGTAAILWGAKKIGDENISGWYWFLLGDLLWIRAGIEIFNQSGNPAVIICEVLFLMMHIRGLFKWRKTRLQRYVG